MLERIERLATRLAVMKRHDEETQNRVIILGRENEALRGQIETLRQQLDAAQAEIKTVRGATAADDKRLRDAEERVWPGETRGCDAPDAMADEILHLRQQLDTQRQEAIAAGELMKAEIETLRQQLDKANFAVTLQRAVIERLNKFAWKVRWADCYTETLKALAELDAQPAPAAETAEGGT